MSADSRVAVVVITHQRRDELLGAVQRLLALPEQPHVVVVDNGSTDGTAGAVRRRRDTALLRMRGASTRHVMVAAALESVCVGVFGTICGLLIAAFALRLEDSPLPRW